MAHLCTLRLPAAFVFHLHSNNERHVGTSSAGNEQCYHVDRWNLSRVDLHLSLERLVDDATGSALRAIQRQMETVEKPGEEFDGISLLSDLKSLFTALDYGLQHFMRRDVGFEVFRIPQFTHQLSETLDQIDHDITRSYTYISVIAFLQEIITQGTHIDQSLELAVSVDVERERKPVYL